MGSPRAVRIPRSASVGTLPADDGSRAPARRARRENVAGTQRAVRLTLVYLAFLLVLYVVFLGLERSAPGGSSSAAGNGLLVFTALAGALAVGGALFSLSPAPRWVELDSTGVVVVSRWGRRHRYAPADRLPTRVLRRYPPGPLSHSAVVSVEVSGGPSARRTFLLEEGILTRAPEP